MKAPDGGRPDVRSYSLESRISLALAAGDMALWEWDPETGNGFASIHLNELLGLPRDRPFTHLDQVLPYVHVDDRERLVRTMAEYVASGSHERLHADYRLVRCDGKVLHLRSISRCVRDADGINRFVGTTIDVTQEHQLAEQLEQARKLEAIGRLAGGVAHDFNNLLTAIFASLDLAERADGRSIQRELGTIRIAAERASELTRQLLAFARKQVIRIHAVELNRIVGKLEPMLRRVLGEDIQLSCELAADLRVTRGNDNLVEQVLVNLVTNARESMPGGGVVEIETRNVDITTPDPALADVAPGEYIALVVRDHGAGMDDYTLAHLFEPFFTTKPTGTGLGLASCWGIVKQLAGHITVQSTPGSGSTFTVLFPSAADLPVADEVPAEVAQTRHEAAGRPTTVLIVEDDELLRGAVERGLAERGYRVLIAEDGTRALALAAEQGASIDIAVIDVIMPRMSGRQLADQLRTALPALNVLFASGYTGEVLARRGVLEPDIVLIEKPYTLEDLTARIDATLAAAATTS